MDKLRRLLEVCDYIIRIANSEASWHLKYYLIFSKDASWVIDNEFDLRELYSYYDPDMGYREDVLAYVDAIKELREDLRKIVEGGDTSED